MYTQRGPSTYLRVVAVMRVGVAQRNSLSRQSYKLVFLFMVALG